nr:hypothetical protein [Staphylococcus epidermidis]
MNKLLIDDYPIQVLPALANEIGLNEAIILQQIHYWLNKTNHNYDGKRWIYNSYPKWIEQFPFWSESTIKRTITSLEKQNLLHIGNYNKAGFDRTKWYSINYIVLNELMTRPSGQNDPTKRSKWSDEEVNLNRPIPETTPETSSKTTSKDILSATRLRTLTVMLLIISTNAQVRTTNQLLRRIKQLYEQEAMKVSH